MSEQPVNEAYKEILRLDKLLTDAGIPHGRKRSSDGWRIDYPMPGRCCVCAVFEFTTTYGCKMDRLEIQGLLNSKERKLKGGNAIGWLTAENVFDRIKRDWERRKTRHEKVESEKT